MGHTTRHTCAWGNNSRPHAARRCIMSRVQGDLVTQRDRVVHANLKTHSLQSEANIENYAARGGQHIVCQNGRRPFLRSMFLDPEIWRPFFLKCSTFENGPKKVQQGLTMVDTGSWSSMASCRGTSLPLLPSQTFLGLPRVKRACKAHVQPLQAMHPHPSPPPPDCPLCGPPHGAVLALGAARHGAVDGPCGATVRISGAATRPWWGRGGEANANLARPRPALYTLGLGAPRPPPQRRARHVPQQGGAAQSLRAPSLED